MESNNIFTAILGVIIMAVAFLAAGVGFAIIDACPFRQALSEYALGCTLVSIMAGLMFALAIYESER
jgi:hypothetical protein